MKRLFKFSAYTFLGLCGLIALAFIALSLISSEQYKSWTAAAVKSATGRELVIEGPFDLQFGTRINLLAEDISFSNSQWGSRDDMATADRLFVELALLPLFKGVLDLSLELDGTDLLFETNDRGEGNWVFSATGATAPEPAAPAASAETEELFILPFKPYIRNFKIRDFLFSFNDSDADKAIETRLETLRLFVNEAEELPLALNAVYQGSPVILEGTLGNINDWYANRQTPVKLNGKLNEADLTIEGTAGPIYPDPAAQLELSLTAADIATFSPFAGLNLPELSGLDIGLRLHASGGKVALETININLDDPELKVAVNGQIDDLTELSGISLKAEVSTDQGTALSQKFGGLNIDSIPDSLLFTADLQGDLETLAMNNLDIVVEDQGVDIKLSGKMENILKLKGADATLTATIETLDIVGGYIGRELPVLGPIDLSATLISPDNSSQLKSLIINLKDPALTAQVSATTGRISRAEQNKLVINDISIQGSADSDQLNGIVKKLGIELPVALPSSFSLKTAAAGNLDKLGIDVLDIALKDEGVDAQLSAIADNILDQSGIRVTLTTDVASTANLSKFAGTEISDLGSLILRGELSSADNTYKLDGLDIELGGKDIQAKINATIQDLLVLARASEEQEQIGAAGIDLTLDADVSSISGLIAEVIGIQPADLGTLKINGHVRSADEMLTLESFNLQLHSDDLNGQIKATIKNLLALANVAEKPAEIGAAGIDLSLNADIVSISDLVATTTGIKMAELGELQIQGQARSVEQALELTSLNAVLKDEGLEVKIDTTIADIFALSGLNSTLSAKIDSLQTLSSITKLELPATGPWLLNGRASSAVLQKSPLLFNASLEGEGSKTVLDATIPDLTAPRNILAKLSVDAESLTVLGNSIDKDLPGDEPLRITANIAASPGKFNLEKIMVLLGQGTIVSDLTYSEPLDGETGRKKLAGQVSIQDIDITPFLPADTPPPDQQTETTASTEAVDNDQKKKESTGDEKLFSSEPFEISALQDYDIDLKIEAKNFTIREGFTTHGNAAVNLDRGLFRFDPFNLVGNTGGTAEAVIELDARKSPAHLDVYIDFNNFVSPRTGGTLNSDFDVESEGDSIAALMGNLDGVIIGHLNDADLEKTFLSKLGAGLLSQINPLSKDHTTLECGIVRFDITDGMAEFEDKLAIQTTEVTWIGGGEINLKTEGIEMGIVSKARKAVSSLTDFGVASFIKIDGTLANPSISLDKSELGKKYASYAAAVATGGLSYLAQKAYDNRQSNKDQCERILAELKEKK